MPLNGSNPFFSGVGGSDDKEGAGEEGAGEEGAGEDRPAPGAGSLKVNLHDRGDGKE